MAGGFEQQFLPCSLGQNNVVGPLALLDDNIVGHVGVLESHD